MAKEYQTILSNMIISYILIYFVKDRHLVAKKSETILSMQAAERQLKIFIESLGLRVSKTFVQTNGYYREISIDFFWQRISESIMHLHCIYIARKVYLKHNKLFLCYRCNSFCDIIDLITKNGWKHALFRVNIVAVKQY